jgi:hypothetical protein
VAGAGWCSDFVCGVWAWGEFSLVGLGDLSTTRHHNHIVAAVKAASIVMVIVNVIAMVKAIVIVKSHCDHGKLSTMLSITLSVTLPPRPL